jgi:hypothetical protein
MSIAETFNQSRFSRFINSSAGRVFRLVACAGFLVVGYLFRDHLLGMISMAFSVLPLSAGAMLAIRNPRGHENLIDTPDRCLDHLSLASLLIRRLEESRYKCR